VVAGLGDGSYGFANPLACHHAAAMHDIPILTLVLNNGGYGAVERATRALHPQGQAALSGMALVSLAPSPRYDQVIAACGGWGPEVPYRSGAARGSAPGSSPGRPRSITR
jgi:acetolactate synthase-1/2/3 large subunit